MTEQNKRERGNKMAIGANAVGGLLLSGSAILQAVTILEGDVQPIRLALLGVTTASAAFVLTMDAIKHKDERKQAAADAAR